MSASTYIINDRRRPVPPQHAFRNPDHYAVFQEAVRRVTSLGITVTEDENAEYEGGVEDLLRLDAAIQHSPMGRTWVQNLQTDQLIATDGSGATPTQDQLHHVVTFGPPRDSVTFPGQFHPLDPATGLPFFTKELDYWNYQAITSRMGRETYRAGFNPDDPTVTSVTEAIAAVNHDPSAQTLHAFIKPVKAKKYPATIVSMDTTNHHLTFEREFAWDWAPVSEEGRAGTMLVQPVTPMFHEYRVFIVDGRAVTGAGAIDHLTPLDAAAYQTEDARQDEQNSPYADFTMLRHPFDIRTIAQRHNPADVDITIQPMLTEQLVQFAEEAACALRTEQPELDTCVIDVAVDERGEPLIIEVNNAHLSGFFASDPNEFVKAFVDYHEGNGLKPSDENPRFAQFIHDPHPMKRLFATTQARHTITTS